MKRGNIVKARVLWGILAQTNSPGGAGRSGSSSVSTLSRLPGCMCEEQVHARCTCCRPAQSPALNTLRRRTEEREVRSSARPLEVSLFFKLRTSRLQGAGVPSASRSPLDTGGKRASRRFRKMELTGNNLVGQKRLVPSAS